MRALVASIVAVALLAAPLARADDELEGAALVHLDRGVAAYRAGDYQQAHRELLAAHELAPDKPNPYRWLALTEVQLDDCPRALVSIEGFLSRVPADEPRAAELIRLREMCERTGALIVESTPPAVSLRIDDAVVGTTPYRALSMRAGSYTLVADKAGYRSQSRSVVVTAGGELAVHLELDRASRPITRRWWFWPAVIGAAVTITGAVVLLSRGPDETVLPPIHCDPAGCAP